MAFTGLRVAVQILPSSLVVFVLSSQGVAGKWVGIFQQDVCHICHKQQLEEALHSHDKMRLEVDIDHAYQKVEVQRIALARVQEVLS